MSKETSKETKSKVQQKVAPANIIVDSMGGRNVIDRVINENPGKGFVYAPSGTSDESLANGGLRIVKDKLGNPLTDGKKIVCEDISDVRIQQIQAEHMEATERVSQVRDTTSAFSKDATSSKKNHVS